MNKPSSLPNWSRNSSKASIAGSDSVNQTSNEVSKTKREAPKPIKIVESRAKKMTVFR